MSREILFRIKDGNNKWVYGFPLVYDDGSFAFVDRNPLNELKPTEMCEINSAYNETLGQFTGLTDKNGTKIFEGDIILSQEFRNKPFSKNSKSKRLIGVVEYYDRKLNDGKQIYKSGYRVRFINDNEKSFYNCGAWSDFYDCEVIGDIHDNPELLEV